MKKRIIISLLVSFCIYFSISLALIYWPIPVKKDIKNYDYTSLKKKSNSLQHSNKLWIIARDSAKLFSRIYKSESKDVMILIHGSGSESRYLSSLADSIATANIATVLTPDMRGHGENIDKRGDVDYIGQLENDIEDLIKYSKQNLGAKKIILAGHSSGGGFVLRYIGNSRNLKVDKAIMLAPYLGHDSPAVKPNSGGWVTVALKRIIGISMLNYIRIKKFNDLPVLFFNRPENINNKLQLTSYSFNMTVNFAPINYKKEISEINIPCLVLVGKQDESFYPDQIALAFNPAKKFVKTIILDNAKHLSLVKKEETFEKIKDWIKLP